MADRTQETGRDIRAASRLDVSTLNFGNWQRVREQLTTRVLVFCDRCGAECDAERVDVSGFGDAERGHYVWGRIVCPTPGCVDECGSAAVDPPDEPGELTHRDRRWLRQQRELAAEYGRVAWLLAVETAGW